MKILDIQVKIAGGVSFIQNDKTIESRETVQCEDKMKC